MIKYISGDFPKSTTITVIFGIARMAWGVRKGEDLLLDGCMNAIDIISNDKDNITFSCLLNDGRHFVAVADNKTVEKLKITISKRAATPTGAQENRSPSWSELYAAEKEKMKEKRGEQDAATPTEVQENRSPSLSDSDTTEATKNEQMEKSQRKIEHDALMSELRQKEILKQVKKQTDKQAEKEQIQLDKQAEKEKLKQYDKDGIPYCPKCHSISLSANKKGFGVGKALLGTSAIGRLGLLAGTIGQNNIEITCLKCGHKFKV